ncbi:MAG: ribonuclease HI family protein [Patescibacteria group bacterium]|nr:ribonuclease HI family protein [Patescibacteria group bacterium]
MTLNIFTDGGSRGNPGPAAVGVVINDEAYKILHSFGQTIGIATNNIAEYQAVIAALQWLLQQPIRPTKISFFLDSTLVVNQLNGLWKLKDARLRQKVILIRQLEASLNATIAYTAIPRTQNSAADLQVNLALDQAL